MPAKRKPKLKNPHMPTGKEPGVEYVNLYPDYAKCFEGHRLFVYPSTGFHTAIITVWLTKEEIAYHPTEPIFFHGPGKVKYIVKKTCNISAEFVKSC